MLGLKKKIIRRENGDAYLIRWEWNNPFFGIKLHHIVGSDDDRDLHDHPWSFLSIILWGGYWEHLTVDDAWHRSAGPLYPAGYEITGEGHKETARKWYGPGSVLWRPLPWPHRLELPAGKKAWTLVFTGPYRREWGFHTICGFIPWPRYQQAKEEGC